MRKKLILLVLMFLSTSSIAGPVVTAKIEKIRVRTQVAFIKLAGCPKYNIIRLETEYGKAMFSTALTAATAGKKLSVEFVESDGCQTAESEFNYVEVEY